MTKQTILENSSGNNTQIVGFDQPHLRRYYPALTQTKTRNLPLVCTDQPEKV
ncbi:MAG: hypothetical protein ACFCUV_08695 [Rivularia sp. (in: cyanobacteria)]